MAKCTEFAPKKLQNKLSSNIPQGVPQKFPIAYLNLHRLGLYSFQLNQIFGDKPALWIAFCRCQNEIDLRNRAKEV